MAKPAGSLCNLACRYCYYTEKGNLYAQDSPKGRYNMDDETLEEFIRQYITSHPDFHVSFTWHGGEPLMRPLSFYKQVIKLQQKYAGWRTIDNCIQTNGTLLTDEWCEFFRENNWLVGISIDGPQEFHDEYRRAVGGRPSFLKVMQGIRLLQKHGVEWNAMGVVNDFNADYPLEVYHFLKEIGCRHLQFAPIVERFRPHPDGRHLASPSQDGASNLAPFSVSPQQYSHFYNTIFDEWVRHDVGQTYVQLFDSTLARWIGSPPGVCMMAETCGHAAVIEHNGDVYSCDHFVFPEYFLGNIHQKSISAMMNSGRQLEFGLAKRKGLPRQCRCCKWLFACNGGCPKDRFCHSAEGESGLNYLCEGFQAYFQHVAPYMDFMKKELEHHRPPANVMKWIPAIEGETGLTDNVEEI